MLTMCAGLSELPGGDEALVQIRSGSRWKYVITANLPPNFQEIRGFITPIAEMTVTALSRDLPNLIS